MTIRRDTAVVVDIEATCWENNRIPDGQRNEIIEIGVCTYSIKTGERTDKRSIMVTPIASEVSPFCTQLTSITPEMVAENGIDFADACAILQDEYATKSRLWISWGNYDRRMFETQCEWRGVQYPFSDNHCNLKKLFGKYYTRQMGMARAMKKAGLELEGTHHRGDDDAWNIALILNHLLIKEGKDILLPFW